MDVPLSIGQSKLAHPRGILWEDQCSLLKGDSPREEGLGICAGLMAYPLGDPSIRLLNGPLIGEE